MKKLILLSVLVMGCKQEPAQPPKSFDGLDEMQRRIAIAPSYENHINLGLQFALRGNSVEAIAAYRKATQINPGAPLAYNNLCAELNNLRQFEEAISNCEKAIHFEPKFALAIANLNHAKVQLKQKGR